MGLTFIPLARKRELSRSTMIMTSVNLACLQTITDDATAQRAMALLLAITTDPGLDVERLAIYRRAVEAGFYTDNLPHAYVPFICGPCLGPHTSYPGVRRI